MAQSPSIEKNTLLPEVRMAETVVRAEILYSKQIPIFLPCRIFVISGNTLQKTAKTAVVIGVAVKAAKI